MLEISVVVPVRDGASSLPTLLNSLATQDLDTDRYEVIVVDNASRDGSAEVATAYGARVVSEPVANRSRARNTGARAAHADLLAFTDADCVVSREWLSSLLARRDKAPLVSGPVEITTGESPNAIERFETFWRFAQADAARQGWAATANLMVERRAFEAIGGFDTTYRHIGEDVDFCLRARRAGHRLAYCERAVVNHAAEHELRAVMKRAFFHGYSAAQVLRRLGVGHSAWRDPWPAVWPGAALAFHAIPTTSLSSRDRLTLSALGMAAYASRVAGSAWASVRRVR